MSCPFEPKIGDYVERTLSPSERRDVATHLATCASCRAIAADLAAIRSIAATLERHVPSPRLWTHIESALDTAPPTSTLHGWWLRVMASGRIRRPLAAMLAVLILGAAAWIGVRRNASPAASPAVGVGELPLPQELETELTLAEEHYARAAAALERIAEEDTIAMDPQTSAILRRNLTVIDQAIAESRRALAIQPADAVAQESLFEALRSKVALLQDTMALVNEMRQGEPAATAREASEINQ